MTLIQIAALIIFALVGVVAVSGFVQAFMPFLPKLARPQRRHRSGYRPRNMIAA